MISSIGPSLTTDVSLSLSSSNPSPVKTAWSLNNSYPVAPVPHESRSTGGKRVPRAGRVVSKSPKSQLFVALFDYNPKSYCSTGHPERELTIKTGKNCHPQQHWIAIKHHTRNTCTVFFCLHLMEHVCR